MRYVAVDLIEILLDLDPRLLFMMDARGALPLSYVQTRHFEDWINFLHIKKDVFWPPRQTRGAQDPPPLTAHAANSRPVPDPDNALSFELVRMVASGRMSPEEIALLQNDNDDDEEEKDDDDDDDSLGSHYSLSSKCSGVSFGGYTFNFSDSDESSSSSEDDNEDDNDDDSYETEGVEPYFEKVLKLSTRPPPLCPTWMSSLNNSSLNTPLKPVPASPFQKKCSYTPPQGPVPTSQIKHMDSLTILEERSTLGNPNEKKNKSFSSNESRILASKDSHSHNINISRHFEIGFRAKATKSTSSFESQSDQSYQAFPSKRMHSSGTLTTSSSSTRTNMFNMFCLPEGDDGMLEGNC